MADEKPGVKKAPIKKTVNKAAAVKKAAAPKKAVTKKSTVKKPAGATAKATVPSAPSAAPVEHPETLATIQTIVEEMRRESGNRDKQLTSLVSEVRRGFTHFNERVESQSSTQDLEMNRLHDSLKHAFSNAEDSSKQNEQRSLTILKSLSDSLMKEHEMTLKEMQEQSRLQDKKIEDLTTIEERRARRNRWMSIPSMIIAIIAIIYMFYVVNVMEGAMTNMSEDMDDMSGYMGEMNAGVKNMSAKMNGMSADTHVMQGGVKEMSKLMSNMADNTSTMSEDMDQLNANLTRMNYDLNVLTRQVSPTMKGMRDMMPWAD